MSKYSLADKRPKILYCLCCDNGKKQNRTSGMFQVKYNDNKIFLKCKRCGAKYYINQKDLLKNIILYK